MQDGQQLKRPQGAYETVQTQKQDNERQGIMNNETYKNNPRDYALELVEEGIVTAEDMLLNMLKAMSHDDIKWALDANELSPRFDEEEEYDYTEEQEVRNAFWEAHPEYKEIEGQSQNSYNATVRTAWCDYVDMLEKDGQISEDLASEVTL